MIRKILFLLYLFTFISAEELAFAPETCGSCGDGYHMAYSHSGLTLRGTVYNENMDSAYYNPPDTDSCETNNYVYTDYYNELITEWSPTSHDFKQYRRDYWFSCSPDPVCDSNETLNKSVYPPVCEDTPQPTCVLPEILTDVNGTPTCVNPDTDGDGIPDSEDWDDDNDGISDAQEVLDGTDPKDSSSNNGALNPEPSDCADTCGIENANMCVDNVSLSSLSTPIATLYYTPCDDCSQNYGRDMYGKTCDELMGTAEEPEPEIESCAHDVSRLGFPFQKITKSAVECSKLIYSTALHGVGQKQPLYNCSEGTTACFFHPKLDDSSETNNTEIPDSNLTDSFDDSAIVEKLTDIELVNQSILSAVNVVDDSINVQTDKLSSKFDEQNTLLSSNNKELNKNVNDGFDKSIQAVNDSSSLLGTKLDGIKQAIEDNKFVYPEDQELKLEYDEIETDSMLSGFTNQINTEFNSHIDTYRSDILTLASVTIPTPPNCGCSDIPLNIDIAGHSFNEVVEICSPLDSLFDIMRPLLWFSFLVSTLFYFFRKE